MSTTRTRPSHAARPLRTASSSCMALLVALALAPGCGSPGPAPAYPSPEDPALEDTEFSGVLGLDNADEESGDTGDDDWEDPGAGGSGAAQKPSGASR